MTVKGANFVESSQSDTDLLCIFTVESCSVKVPATYVGEGILTCPTAEALRSKRNAASIYISISNDKGKTASSPSFEISFRRDLPRLLKVARPDLFFADGQSVDIVIEGRNFHEGMQLTARLISAVTPTKLDTVTAYCNVTSTF